MAIQRTHQIELRKALKEKTVHFDFMDLRDYATRYPRRDQQLRVHHTLWRHLAQPLAYFFSNCFGFPFQGSYCFFHACLPSAEPQASYAKPIVASSLDSSDPSSWCRSQTCSCSLRASFELSCSHKMFSFLDSAALQPGFSCTGLESPQESPLFLSHHLALSRIFPS